MAGDVRASALPKKTLRRLGDMDRKKPFLDDRPTSLPSPLSQLPEGERGAGLLFSFRKNMVKPERLPRRDDILISPIGDRTGDRETELRKCRM